MDQLVCRYAEGGAAAGAAAAAAATDGEKSTWRKPIFFNHVGWRRLSDDDVITFDPGATGLLVQLEDSLVSTTTPGDASQYARRGGTSRGRYAADRKKGGNNRRGKNKKKEQGAGWEESGEVGDRKRATTTADKAVAAVAAAGSEEKAAAAATMAADAAAGSTNGGGAKTRRAANFWKLNDGDGNVEGGGNNPYRGKASSAGLYKCNAVDP
jgi:hypothetical protein